MHYKLMKASGATTGATCYVVFSCDEVFIVDNQF
jgi:hypothetical protein